MRPALEATGAMSEHGWAVRVVVTGGHSEVGWARHGLLEPSGPGLPAIADRVEPELLLKGLGLLAERERSAATR
jgi:hypothetical protein